jgi:MFS family permease
LGVLGSSIGSIASGYLTRRYGRKKPSLASLVPYVLGYGMIVFSKDFYTMLAGQVLVGLTQGVRAPISRMFLSEISHPKHRGFYVSNYIAATMAFQLTVYVAALWLDWVYLAAYCAFVPLLFTPLMLYVPESHVWLIANDREEEAKDSLQWFYGDEYDIEDVYREELNHRVETREAMTSWRDIFR